MSEKKNPAAVELGRKGGENSRKNLTEAEAKELAQRAARARWGPANAKKAVKPKPKPKPKKK